MKKLKKIWQENSVLFVLFSILIVCIIAILIVMVTYFIGSSKSKYGERLENIEKYPFIEKGEIESKIKENKGVTSLDIHTSGRIIYVDLAFDSEVTLEEAKGIALASLDNFKEETLSYYDIQYFITALKTEKTEGYNLMGAHNASGTGGISWVNNVKVETEEDEK